MTITSISYSRLVSFGNYENASLSATAQLEESEDVAAALDELKSFVDGEAIAVRQGSESSRRLRGELNSVEYELADKKREVDRLKDQASRMTEFLANHGVDIRNEVPF